MIYRALDIHKPSEKLIAVTPKNNVKKVKFSEPLTSSNNTQQVESSKTSDSNTHVLSSIGVKCSYNYLQSTTYRHIKEQKIGSCNLIGNACPLTRITATNKKPHRVPIPLDVVAQDLVVTKVYTRRPKVPKTNGSNRKPKIAKLVISNNTEPGTSWGSNTSVALSSSLIDYRLSKIDLWYLTPVLQANMTKDRSQLTQFRFKSFSVHSAIYKRPSSTPINGVGDYQIGNVTISRVYYVEGLGYNLFFVGQFCDSDLEVAFRKHTCFVRNLEGVDLLACSQGTNLYSLSIGDMMASSPLCLLSKPRKLNLGYGTDDYHI
ncbi:hypothetical protein Tco_1448151 [Tanacetum coccineum]